MVDEETEREEMPFERTMGIAKGLNEFFTEDMGSKMDKLDRYLTFERDAREFLEGAGYYKDKVSFTDRWDSRLTNSKKFWDKWGKGGYGWKNKDGEDSKPGDDNNAPTTTPNRTPSPGREPYSPSPRREPYVPARKALPAWPQRKALPPTQSDPTYKSYVEKHGVPAYVGRGGDEKKAYSKPAISSRKALPSGQSYRALPAGPERKALTPGPSYKALPAGPQRKALPAGPSYLALPPAQRDPTYASYVEKYGVPAYVGRGDEKKAYSKPAVSFKASGGPTKLPVRNYANASTKSYSNAPARKDALYKAKGGQYHAPALEFRRGALGGKGSHVYRPKK